MSMMRGTSTAPSAPRTPSPPPPWTSPGGAPPPTSGATATTPPPPPPWRPRSPGNAPRQSSGRVTVPPMLQNTGPAGTTRSPSTRVCSEDGVRHSTTERGGPNGLPSSNRMTAGKSARDRKSTRLNSSHSQISYAVFCLKKKKKQQDRVELVPPSRVHCKELSHSHETGHDIQPAVRQRARSLVATSRSSVRALARVIYDA